MKLCPCWPRIQSSPQHLRHDVDDVNVYCVGCYSIGNGAIPGGIRIPKQVQNQARIAQIYLPVVHIVELGLYSDGAAPTN